MDFDFAATILNGMIAVLLSLSIHEFAHAFAAKLQGDRTAELQGRLTLNPIAHADPVGTVILPIVGLALGGFLFGYAKPVPVQPSQFKSKKWGEMIVAGAGPASNLILCTLSVFLYYGLQLSDFGGSEWALPFQRLLSSMIMINAVLAFLNLIPIYPLDGGHIIRSLLPYNLKLAFDRYLANPWVPMIVFVLLILKGFEYLRAVALFYVNLSEWFFRILFF